MQLRHISNLVYPYLKVQILRYSVVPDTPGTAVDLNSVLGSLLGK